MSTPTLNDDRARMLEAHAGLRRSIDRVRRSPEYEGLFHAMIALGRVLERHLDEEDRSFLPRLAHGDAWGPVRVERILDDHEAQRAMIAGITDDLCARERNPDHLVQEIRWFLHALEDDLDEEERLCPEEALGNAVVVDQTDG